MKALRYFLPLLLLIMLAPSHGYAACSGSSPNLTAASANETDVSACVTAASNGDTITVPSGTGAWTSTLTISKAVTIIGQTCTLDGNGRATSCPTIFQDQNNVGGVDNGIMSITLVANKQTRISQVEITQSGAGSGDNGVIQVSGANTDSGCATATWATCRNFRFDHSVIQNLNGVGIFNSDVLGVIDHNTCSNSSSSPPICFYTYHENWNGYTDSDGSFADTNHFGSGEFLIIENNNVTYSNAFYALSDAYRGARYVARFNTLTNVYLEMHGTDSGSRLRGTRAVENYDNTYICTLGAFRCSFITFVRSGALMVWGNSLSSFTSPIASSLNIDRLFFPFAPFNMADGTSPLDVNTGGSPFDSGTATSGSGILSLTDSSKTWTTNQWVGYSLLKTSNCAHPPYCGSVITGNTSNTITVASDGEYAQLNQSTANTNASASSGSTLSFASVPAGIVNGIPNSWTVCPQPSYTCAGIPANTYVTGGTSTTVTLSNPISGTVSNGELITFTWAPLALATGDTYAIDQVSQAIDAPGRALGTRFSATNISSITSSGTTATVTMPVSLSSLGWTTGTVVIIGQAIPQSYQVTASITATGANTFTYTFAGGSSPASYPGDATALPAGWNNQAYDPVYAWLNTQSATNVINNTEYNAQEVENANYYNYGGSVQISNASPFNGTPSAGNGVGVGTITNRPTSCSGGAFYWATDQGSWNSSGSGGQGLGYHCISGSWSQDYTPYNYPHPLSISGNSQSFSSQPTNTVSGNTVSPNVTDTLTSTSVDSITVSVSSGTCTITGTTTANSAGGSMNTVSFTLTAGTTGTNCTLKFHDNTDGTVTDVTSNSFDIGAVPTISVQPQSQTISSGQMASLSVTASGAPSPSYQWYQGSSCTGSTVGTNSSSYMTAALTITTTYSVKVTNEFGNVCSSNAVITVNAASVGRGRFAIRR